MVTTITKKDLSDAIATATGEQRQVVKQVIQSLLATIFT